MELILSLEVFCELNKELQDTLPQTVVYIVWWHTKTKSNLVVSHIRRSVIT